MVVWIVHVVISSASSLVYSAELNEEDGGWVLEPVECLLQQFFKHAFINHSSETVAAS
jgi:hypothetical protein